MAADQDLKQRWGAAMAVPPSAHLTDEVWERLFSGEALAPARAEAFEHVSECATCASTYRELAHLREGARAFDPGVPARSARGARVPLWGWMGAAAAALLAVAVGLNGYRIGSPPPPVPSPTDGLRSGGSAVPLPLAPRGPLAEAPAAFRWDPAAGQGAYQVELLSSAGNRLWSSPVVADSSVAWPGGLRLEPGRYYWRVVAKPGPTSALGESVTSPLVQIDLGAPSAP